MPSQSSTLPTDLQAFIQAEMARRCLSSVEECLYALAREAKERQVDDDDAIEALVWPSPPSNNSSDYNPVLHGARSIDELRGLLIEAEESGPGREFTPAVRAEIKSRIQRRAGQRG